MPAPANLFWWIFVAGVLAVTVLVGALGIAMVAAQRQRVAMHRQYTERLLQAYEEERRRVALEVHDDAVQRLALLHHELNTFSTSAPDLSAADQHHLHGIQGEVEDLTQVLRELAHRLHPATIEHGGLVPALTQLAEELDRAHRLSVSLDLPEAPLRLPREVAVVLFRIAQEGLRNVIRHAGVQTATLTLRELDHGIELVVRDRGVGFDASGARRAGIGLIGIEERAHLAGGTAQVVSRPGEGTTVTARIPQTLAP